MLTYPVTGLTGNVTYYYRVRAYNTTCTSSNSNSISATTIVTVLAISTPLITGAPFNVDCNTSATGSITFSHSLFNTGNIFTAQLSDNTGSFASPISIGTGNYLATNFNITIPANTPTGSNNYKIRVVGSDPVVIGDTSATFTITDQSWCWYNADWSFRRPVSIPNSGSTVLTDYQVKITLNSTFDFANTNNNGNDIRITLEDGTTEIPFWIEEWNAGSSATIWARVPTIPTSGTAIYLYYGNANAIAASNGNTTFRFFDDFESWNAAPGSSGWSDKASLPTPQADGTSAVYNDKMYYIGGYNNGPTDPKNKNYCYDPSTDTWS